MLTEKKTFVGIDVGKFEYCVFCSQGEVSFSLANTADGPRKLIERLGRAEIVLVQYLPRQ